MSAVFALGRARRGRGLPAILLVALAALLVLGASQPLHVHAADGPSFYNEAHLLSPLGTLTAGAPLPAAGVALGVPPSRPHVAAPVQGRLASGSDRSADPRAPPRA